MDEHNSDDSPMANISGIGSPMPAVPPGDDDDDDQLHTVPAALDETLPNGERPKVIDPPTLPDVEISFEPPAVTEQVQPDELPLVDDVSLETPAGPDTTITASDDTQTVAQDEPSKQDLLNIFASEEVIVEDAEMNFEPSTVAAEESDATSSETPGSAGFQPASKEESGVAEEPINLVVDAEQLLQVAGGGEVAPSDGIEILVRLAQKGEIDPKNVDIIDVTDKFLKLIAAAPKENLRQSGKILFHACVLLRMKAEALLNFTAEEPSGDDFMDFDEDGGLGFDSDQPRQITLKDLERAIVRRAQRRQVRKRQVTLDELIEALREAERIEKLRAERKPPRAVIELAGQHEVDGVEDLLDLAHDEDVETTIEKVEILLAKILKLGEKIELMRMVSLMDSHNDWVDAFLASLFLSNAGKIDLYQDEFYGPLFIGLGGSSMSDTVVT